MGGGGSPVPSTPIPLSWPGPSPCLPCTGVRKRIECACGDGFAAPRAVCPRDLSPGGHGGGHSRPQRGSPQPPCRGPRSSLGLLRPLKATALSLCFHHESPRIVRGSTFGACVRVCEFTSPLLSIPAHPSKDWRRLDCGVRREAYESLNCQNILGAFPARLGLPRPSPPSLSLPLLILLSTHRQTSRCDVSAGRPRLTVLAVVWLGGPRTLRSLPLSSFAAGMRQCGLDVSSVKPPSAVDLEPPRCHLPRSYPVHLRALCIVAPFEECDEGRRVGREDFVRLPECRSLIFPLSAGSCAMRCSRWGLLLGSHQSRRPQCHSPTSSVRQCMSLVLPSTPRLPTSHRLSPHLFCRPHSLEFSTLPITSAHSRIACAHDRMHPHLRSHTLACGSGQSLPTRLRAHGRGSGECSQHECRQSAA